ncbi:N-acetylglucosamine-6-phosphate deacetylase [Alkalihalobacillus clausii]|jgi:N-acetylglucosamine-6-phosphate deacetylase|uniref:N-acetylglucosamine-6-phosphate deacetylase n=1 Tax=Shouchella clausii TaxID=79880 RepID=UPI000BA52B39|nr:N-acetylglucosamine-6-phosphate deacetylase [Shouchella clausii]MCM3550074.1 N-acetylglucosamine-6-phosphate deacetylase [Shouchella clausii]PAF14593.1 N-acetylglucosamine-6-phosphate deacetylase [Shouchella clausii]
MASIVVTGGQLITGEPGCRKYEKGFLAINNGKITAVGVGNGDDYKNEDTVQITIPADAVVVPGFVDVHIHGGYGADVMDRTKDALQTMAANLPAEGTTAFLATTITQKHEHIEAAIENVVAYRRADKEAEIVGLHIEGPFINETKKGAQPLEYIVEPSVPIMKKWMNLAEGMIKQVTYAPEKRNGSELAAYLRSEGANPSIGHSDAVYSEMEQAVAAGANQVTHMYNGMRSLHHREPGVAGGALLLGELDIELIVDGIHIHPEMVKLAWKAKGTNQCLLITDSMRAKGLPDGAYDLGGQDVSVNDGRATLSDGTLAGSVLQMNKAVANMVAYTGCSLEQAVQMASYNPAKKIGIDAKKGSLAPGKDGDFTVLTKEGDVLYTYCLGKKAYGKEDDV